MSDAVKQVPFSKKNVLIRLNDFNQYSKWDKILQRIGGTRNNSNDDPGWILSKNQVKQFEDALCQYGSRQRTSKRSRNKNQEDSSIQEPNSPQRKGSRFRNSKQIEDEQNTCKSKNDSRSRLEDKEDSEDGEENSEDNESDDSSEDELIQAVLKRRLQSESSCKSIETETIDNSDDEDCVSYSRRLRHIYKVLKNQRERIIELEEIITNKFK